MASEYESHSHAFAAHIKKNGKAEKKKMGYPIFQWKDKGQSKESGAYQKKQTHAHTDTHTE